MSKKCPALTVRADIPWIEAIDDLAVLLRLGNRSRAHFQAPVGIEVIQHPVKALDLREPPGHVTQVCRKVHTGPGRSQVANEFTSRYDKRGDQERVFHIGCSLAHVARACRSQPVVWGLDGPMLAFPSFHHSKSPIDLVGTS